MRLSVRLRWSRQDLSASVRANHRTTGQFEARWYSGIFDYSVIDFMARRLFVKKETKSMILFIDMGSNQVFSTLI